MPLLPSLIVGLSRKPLAAPEQAIAGNLGLGEQSPATQALGLLAAQSLAQRSRVDTASAQASHDTIPAHPDYGNLGASIADYLDASRLVAGKPEVTFLVDRGLLAPGPWLLNLLETRFRTPPIPWQAYGLLGPRGGWLARMHPRFAGKLTFLSRDAVPKSAKQRVAFAAYHWANLRAFPELASAQNGLRVALGGLKLSPEDFGLLSRALEKRELIPTLPQNTWIRLFEGKAALRVYERVWLGKALDDAEAFAKTEAASTTLQRLAETEDLTDDWELLTEAALIAKDREAAARLLRLSAKQQNALLVNHPRVVWLASILDAPAYARVMERAAERYPKGWRDPMVVALAECSPHPFSQSLSEHLVHESLHHFGPPSESLAVRFISKLHPSSAELLMEELHNAQSSRIGSALLAMLLAKRVISQAVPLP